MSADTYAAAVRTKPTIAQNRLLRAALHAARKSLRGVEKADTARVRSKKGEGSSYTYQFTSSEDMIAACRDALHEADVTCELVSWAVGEPLPKMQCPTLWSTFEVCHVPSGETEERRYPMPIASSNDADKAVAGAITYTFGQVMRALLLVPKVSDKDTNDPDRRTTDDGRGWRGGDASPEQRAKAEARVAKAKADAEARKAKGNGQPTPKPGPSGEDAETEALKAKARGLMSELQSKTHEKPKDIITKALGQYVQQPNREQLATIQFYVEERLADLDGSGGGSDPTDPATLDGDAPPWMGGAPSEDQIDAALLADGPEPGPGEEKPL